MIESAKFAERYLKINFNRLQRRKKISVLSEIKKSTVRCFKRVNIKRRLTVPSGSSYFEPDWQNVTATILSVDPVGVNIDNLELNSFTQNEFGLTCKNDDFEWAPESISQSEFFEYLTRHKTKVKIEAGYIDENDTEYAYDVGAGLIVGDEINTQTDGTIYVPCIAPGTLFFEAAADDVKTGGAWYTGAAVSTIVQAIYDLAVGGAGVFAPFLEGSNISPANDVTIDEADFHDWSCADALTALAQASNSAWWIGPDFQLYFQGKGATVASQFTFYGPGERRENINVYVARDYNEGLRNIFNRVAWAETDPRVESKESWAPGDASSTWKYGERQYIVDNRLVTTGATRQAICDSLLAAYKDPKEEIIAEVKLCPQLALLDRVTLTYRGAYNISPGYFWGVDKWGEARWTGRRGGIKVNKDFKITSISHDAMAFKTILMLREI